MQIWAACQSVNRSLAGPVEIEIVRDETHIGSIVNERSPELKNVSSGISVCLLPVSSTGHQQSDGEGDLLD